MRLADFILRNMETILGEWEAFAATLLPAAAGMTSLALRDDAKQILEAVAKDLSTPQTKEAQAEKSKGRAPKLTGASETAAQTHAVVRARSGFDINQLAAEYRALRASVLRLWMEECEPDDISLDDVVLFNEAIDQAIVKSIGFFSAQVDQARNLLLGNAWSRHAQPAKHYPYDSPLPSCVERRGKRIGCGVAPDPQRRFDEGASG